MVVFFHFLNFSTKNDKYTLFRMINFERFRNWSPKSLCKSLKLKKQGGAHQNIFKFQRKLPSLQKTNVEKSTFCNMRFIEVHWLNTLKSRIFHEDSIARDFSWIAPLVFEKIPFYLSKSCGLRPQIYISMQKKIISFKLSHLWSSCLRHWKIHHISLNAR